ncbi:MAG: HAD family hydrolase [Syntrophales bacterium]
MSIIVAAGRGAMMGVLFKNAETIETMRKIDTLVMDKTGTLTLGKPKLTGVVAVDVEEPDMLKLAASLEKGSEHPLAAAIVEAALERDIKLTEMKEFAAHTGG